MHIQHEIIVVELAARINTKIKWVVVRKCYINIKHQKCYKSMIRSMTELMFTIFVEH
jgi:hypothetical protein